MNWKLPALQNFALRFYSELHPEAYCTEASWFIYCAYLQASHICTMINEELWGLKFSIYKKILQQIIYTLFYPYALKASLLGKESHPLWQTSHKQLHIFTGQIFMLTRPKRLNQWSQQEGHLSLGSCSATKVSLAFRKISNMSCKQAWSTC